VSPATLARLRRLELLVAGRVEGLLQGDYRGLLPGPGREAGDARPYALGDDVRRIDWNVTARMARVFVRDTVADHELETTLVVDRSGSMGFGTAALDKAELATAVAGAFGFLTLRGGNRTGAVVLDPAGLRWLPPRSGREHLLWVLGAIATPVAPGPVDLAAGLRVFAGARRRRGLVVVVSDFLDGGAWDRPLRSLATAHDVVAAVVHDPRERSLPDVGVVRFVDAETGRARWVDTASKAVRRRFAEGAGAAQAETVTRIRGAGAHHLSVSTGEDWVAAVVGYVLQRRRRPARA
jgi:uncharacterized protein (DUF58 family)